MHGLQHAIAAINGLYVLSGFVVGALVVLGGRGLCSRTQSRYV